jgi:hypothetical protein
MMLTLKEALLRMQNRTERMARLVKLDAPEIILEGERKLIRKAERLIREARAREEAQD